MLVAFSYLAYAYVAYCVLRIVLKRSWAAHRKAFHKFGVIWAISTTPIFIGYLFSRDDGRGQFLEYFRIEEQFVYAAAFVAPVLYIFYEAIIASAASESTDKLQEFRDKIRGYERLFFPSLLLLATCGLAYAGSRLGASAFKETIFFSTFSGQNGLIYGSALLLWYCSVLLDTPSDKSFGKALKEEADALQKDAEKRLGGRP